MIGARSLVFFVIVSLSFCFISCKQMQDTLGSRSQSTNTDEESGEDTISAENLVVENALAQTYPVGLSVNNFSNEVATTNSGSLETGSLHLSERQGGFDLFANPLTNTDPCYNKENDSTVSRDSSDVSFAKRLAADKLPVQKEKQTRDLIVGSADSCINEDFGISLERLTRGSSKLDFCGWCFRPDKGLISAYDTSVGNDVCLVSFTREMQGQSLAYVDFASSALSSMLCQAKKDGKADAEKIEDLLPDIGDSLDLKDQLKTVLANEGVTVGEASIERLRNHDGFASYKTHVVLTTEGKDFVINLVHIPLNDVNSNNTGVLLIHHPVQNYSTKTRMVSIKYDRSGTDTEPRLRFNLRQAEVRNDKVAQAISQRGELDLFTAFQYTGDNNLIERMKYVTFDGNPLTGEQKLAVWVNYGANYTEMARGYLFNAAPISSDDLRLRGCAVAGASSSNPGSGISIRKAIREDIPLRPKGFFHPFDGGTNSGASVYRQCFIQNSEGNFEIDTDETDSVGFDRLTYNDQKVSTLDDPSFNNIETLDVDFSKSL